MALRISVALRFLDHTDVISILQDMRSKEMPECVTGCPHGFPSLTENFGFV
jgi:hypothetical protein